MKFVSHQLSFVIASSALLLAGCQHTPVRNTPSDTAPIQGPNGMNPPIAGGNIPTDNSIIPSRTETTDPTGGDRLTLAANSVYFDFDQSAIKSAEREKLKAVKAAIDKDPTMRVLLEGHCDWRGTAEYNLSLGDRRAAAAKKYLVSLGVPADKLDTLSKGSLESKANADAATAEKDRRVDCVVLKAK
jgi:peptidoglycan-associated lipoprotein